MHKLEKESENLRDSREEFKRENEKLSRKLDECTDIKKRLTIEK